MTARVDIFYLQLFKLQDYYEECLERVPKNDREKALSCLDLKAAKAQQDLADLETLRHKLGRITLTLIKGQDRVFQSVHLPVSDFFLEQKLDEFEDKRWGRRNPNRTGGKEIFARWVPLFDQLAHDFLTDANGYEVVSHPVVPPKLFNAPQGTSFAASFVPVDASITARDYAERSWFTVWNDRP